MKASSLSHSNVPPEFNLSDELVADIADDIETEEQVETLGRVLGFSQADINRFLATNRIGGRVTSKGTRDMFFAWRQRTPPTKHQEILEAALQRSGLVLLAHRYFPRLGITHGERN